MSNIKTMKERVESYLNHRRALGFKLKIEGEELLRFAKFADKMGHKGPLTNQLSIKWATSSKKASRESWSRRLGIIRCFARFCSITELETESPPKNMLGPIHHRSNPYIYSNLEIASLLDATKHLIPRDGLRPISYYYLFGLLATTGLRVSEALKLTHHDVDLGKALLLIRETKFTKSRFIPLDSSTVNALKKYNEFCNKYVPIAKTNFYFITDNGQPIKYRAIEYAFQKCRKLLNWDVKQNGKKPRLYDLRHTFVCRRILTWYEQGVDVYASIPFLSTYLGHVKVSDTYWYITGIPQLMAVAANRFETFTSGEL